MCKHDGEAVFKDTRDAGYRTLLTAMRDAKRKSMKSNDSTCPAFGCITMRQLDYLAAHLDDWSH